MIFSQIRIGRIGPQLTTLRRATMKQFYGVRIMVFLLVGSLLRHRGKSFPFLTQKEPYKCPPKTRPFKFLLRWISLTTPLLNLQVRLRFGKTQSTRGSSMGELAVNVTAYLTAVSQLYQGSCKELVSPEFFPFWRSDNSVSFSQREVVDFQSFHS